MIKRYKIIQRKYYFKYFTSYIIYVYQNITLTKKLIIKKIYVLSIKYYI